MNSANPDMKKDEHHSIMEDTKSAWGQCLDIEVHGICFFRQLSGVSAS